MTLLNGVTVIEMAQVITGPSAGMMLADLGAEVIKVEPPRGGDAFRAWDASGGTIRPSFAAFNRGKKSIVIDIKTPEGREVYEALIAKADVVIENYRPGRMDRLGVGWKELQALNPRLVYCYVSGRGVHGPDADQPTYDAVAQALSGLWSQLTDLDDPEPVGPPLADQLTALYATIGVLGALRERDRTGRGSRIEVDMLSACLAFSGLGVASATWAGQVPLKTSRARSSQSYAFADAKGRPFAIHLSTPHKFWVALCDVVGRPELVEDERFVTKAARIEHYDVLREVLAEIFATQERDVWLAALINADVPAAPILTVAEAIEAPQVVAKDIIAWDDQDPTRGLVRSPVVVEGRHAEAPCGPPDLGADTDDVLAGLGLDGSQIRHLRDTGTVS